MNRRSLLVILIALIFTPPFFLPIGGIVQAAELQLTGSVSTLEPASVPLPPARPASLGGSTGGSTPATTPSASTPTASPSPTTSSAPANTSNSTLPPCKSGSAGTTPKTGSTNVASGNSASCKSPSSTETYDCSLKYGAKCTINGKEFTNICNKGCDYSKDQIKVFALCKAPNSCQGTGKCTDQNGKAIDCSKQTPAGTDGGTPSSGGGAGAGGGSTTPLTKEQSQALAKETAKEISNGNHTEVAQKIADFKAKGGNIEDLRAELRANPVNSDPTYNGTAAKASVNEALKQLEPSQSPLFVNPEKPLPWDEPKDLPSVVTQTPQKGTTPLFDNPFLRTGQQQTLGQYLDDFANGRQSILGGAMNQPLAFKPYFNNQDIRSIAFDPTSISDQQFGSRVPASVGPGSISPKPTYTPNNAPPGYTPQFTGGDVQPPSDHFQPYTGNTPAPVSPVAALYNNAASLATQAKQTLESIPPAVTEYFSPAPQPVATDLSAAPGASSNGLPTDTFGGSKIFIRDDQTISKALAGNQTGWGTLYERQQQSAPNTTGPSANEQSAHDFVNQQLFPGGVPTVQSQPSIVDRGLTATKSFLEGARDNLVAARDYLFGGSVQPTNAPLPPVVEQYALKTSPFSGVPSKVGIGGIPGGTTGNPFLGTEKGPFAWGMEPGRGYAFPTGTATPEPESPVFVNKATSPFEYNPSSPIVTQGADLRGINPPGGESPSFSQKTIAASPTQSYEAFRGWVDTQTAREAALPPTWSGGADQGSAARQAAFDELYGGPYVKTNIPSIVQMQGQPTTFDSTNSLNDLKSARLSAGGETPGLNLNPSLTDNASILYKNQTPSLQDAYLPSAEKAAKDVYDSYQQKFASYQEAAVKADQAYRDASFEKFTHDIHNGRLILDEKTGKNTFTYNPREQDNLSLDRLNQLQATRDQARSEFDAFVASHNKNAKGEVMVTPGADANRFEVLQGRAIASNKNYNEYAGRYDESAKQNFEIGKALDQKILSTQVAKAEAYNNAEFAKETLLSGDPVTKGLYRIGAENEAIRQQFNQGGIADQKQQLYDQLNTNNATAYNYLNNPNGAAFANFKENLGSGNLSDVQRIAQQEVQKSMIQWSEVSGGPRLSESGSGSSGVTTGVLGMGGLFDPHLAETIGQAPIFKSIGIDTSPAAQAQLANSWARQAMGLEPQSQAYQDLVNASLGNTNWYNKMEFGIHDYLTDRAAKGQAMYENADQIQERTGIPAPITRTLGLFNTGVWGSLAGMQAGSLKLQSLAADALGLHGTVLPPPAVLSELGRQTLGQRIVGFGQDVLAVAPVVAPALKLAKITAFDPAYRAISSSVRDWAGPQGVVSKVAEYMTVGEGRYVPRFESFPTEGGGVVLKNIGESRLSPVGETASFRSSIGGTSFSAPTKAFSVEEMARITAPTSRTASLALQERFSSPSPASMLREPIDPQYRGTNISFAPEGMVLRGPRTSLPQAPTSPNALDIGPGPRGGGAVQAPRVVSDLNTGVARPVTRFPASVEATVNTPFLSDADFARIIHEQNLKYPGDLVTDSTSLNRMAREINALDESRALPQGPGVLAETRPTPEQLFRYESREPSISVYSKKCDICYLGGDHTGIVIDPGVKPGGGPAIELPKIAGVDTTKPFTLAADATFNKNPLNIFSKETNFLEKAPNMAGDIKAIATGKATLVELRPPAGVTTEGFAQKIVRSFNEMPDTVAQYRALGSKVSPIKCAGNCNNFTTEVLNRSGLSLKEIEAYRPGIGSVGFGKPVFDRSLTSATRPDFAASLEASARPFVPESVQGTGLGRPTGPALAPETGVGSGVTARRSFDPNTQVVLKITEPLSREMRTVPKGLEAPPQITRGLSLMEEYLQRPVLKDPFIKDTARDAFHYSIINKEPLNALYANNKLRLNTITHAFNGAEDALVARARAGENVDALLARHDALMTETRQVWKNEQPDTTAKVQFVQQKLEPFLQDVFDSTVAKYQSLASGKPFMPEGAAFAPETGAGSGAAVRALVHEEPFLSSEDFARIIKEDNIKYPGDLAKDSSSLESMARAFRDLDAEGSAATRLPPETRVSLTPEQGTAIDDINNISYGRNLVPPDAKLTPELYKNIDTAMAYDQRVAGLLAKNELSIAFKDRVWGDTITNVDGDIVARFEPASGRYEPVVSTQQGPAFTDVARMNRAAQLREQLATQIPTETRSAIPTSPQPTLFGTAAKGTVALARLLSADPALAEQGLRATLSPTTAVTSEIVGRTAARSEWGIQQTASRLARESTLPKLAGTPLDFAKMPLNLNPGLAPLSASAFKSAAPSPSSANLVMPRSDAVSVTSQLPGSTPIPTSPTRPADLPTTPSVQTSPAVPAGETKSSIPDDAVIENEPTPARLSGSQASQQVSQRSFLDKLTDPTGWSFVQSAQAQDQVNISDCLDGSCLVPTPENVDLTVYDPRKGGINVQGNGRYTANGLRTNINSDTIATPLYPLGTVVRVTLNTGASRYAYVADTGGGVQYADMMVRFAQKLGARGTTPGTVLPIVHYANLAKSDFKDGAEAAKAVVEYLNTHPGAGLEEAERAHMSKLAGLTITRPSGTGVASPVTSVGNMIADLQRSAVRVEAAARAELAPPIEALRRAGNTIVSVPKMFADYVNSLASQPARLANPGLRQTISASEPITPQVIDEIIFNHYAVTEKADKYGNFAHKDVEAAQRAGLSLKDYAVGGMDLNFKINLFMAIQAMEEQGIHVGITSAFRSDDRQAAVDKRGIHAAPTMTWHGGSAHGGYGHGLAADLVGINGTPGDVVWKWVDTYGQQYGIGRPYGNGDRPHVGPTGGREFKDHQGDPRISYANVLSQQRARVSGVVEMAEAPVVPLPPQRPTDLAQSTIPGSDVGPLAFAENTPIVIRPEDTKLIFAGFVTPQTKVVRFGELPTTAGMADVNVADFVRVKLEPFGGAQTGSFAQFVAGPQAPGSSDVARFIQPSPTTQNQVLYAFSNTFDPSKPFEVIYYLHGNTFAGNTAGISDALNRQQVLRQVMDAGGNAVVVIPQFGSPIETNSGILGTPEGWQTFVNETNQRLTTLTKDPLAQEKFNKAPIRLIAYSGGYYPASKALAGLGNKVQTLQVLDGMYNNLSKAVTTWMQVTPNATLISEYLPTTEKGLFKQKSEELAQSLKGRAVTNIEHSTGEHATFVQTNNPITRALKGGVVQVQTPVATRGLDVQPPTNPQLSVIPKSEIHFAGDSIGVDVGKYGFGKDVAVSGRHIKDVPAQLNQLPDNSKVVIIAGTNDLAYPASLMENDVKAVLQRAKEKNIEIIAWVGASREARVTPSALVREARLRQASIDLQAIIAKTNIPYVDLRASSLEPYRLGYHYTEEGYRKIGDMILEAVRGRFAVQPTLPGTQAPTPGIPEQRGQGTQQPASSFTQAPTTLPLINPQGFAMLVQQSYPAAQFPPALQQILTVNQGSFADGKRVSFENTPVTVNASVYDNFRRTISLQAPAPAPTAPAFTVTNPSAVTRPSVPDATFISGTFAVFESADQAQASRVAQTESFVRSLYNQTRQVRPQQGIASVDTDLYPYFAGNLKLIAPAPVAVQEEIVDTPPAPIVEELKIRPDILIIEPEAVSPQVAPNIPTPSSRPIDLVVADINDPFTNKLLTAALPGETPHAAQPDFLPTLTSIPKIATTFANPQYTYSFSGFMNITPMDFSNGLVPNEPQVLVLPSVPAGVSERVPVNAPVPSARPAYIGGTPAPAELVRSPDLREGSRGEIVALLQDFLNNQGYPIPIDGIYGPLTRAAVEQWQRDKGIDIRTEDYGFWGANSRSALIDEASVPKTLTPTTEEGLLENSRDTERGGTSQSSYSEDELMQRYYLNAERLPKNITREDILSTLPPAPEAYPVSLREQEDPLMKTSTLLLGDRDIDQIVQTATHKLNAYWADVFARHGLSYAPTKIVLFGGHFDAPAPTIDMVSHDKGSIYDDEKDTVYLDRSQLRQKALDWANADGATIVDTVSHEMSHRVVYLTGAYAAAHSAADYNQAAHDFYLRGTSIPLNKQEELQADYLSGVAMRGAGLLKAGDPQNIYYATGADGDDFRMILVGRNPTPTALSNVDLPHGTGAERAQAVYAGLLPAGSVETGLTMLGTPLPWVKPNTLTTPGFNALPYDFSFALAVAEDKQVAVSANAAVEKGIFDSGDAGKALITSMSGVTNVSLLAQRAAEIASVIKPSSPDTQALVSDAKALAAQAKEVSQKITTAAASANGKMTPALAAALENGSVATRLSASSQKLLDQAKDLIAKQNAQNAQTPVPTAPAPAPTTLAPAQTTPTPSPSTVTKALKWIEGNILGINQPQAAEVKRAPVPPSRPADIGTPISGQEAEYFNNVYDSLCTVMTCTDAVQSLRSNAGVAAYRAASQQAQADFEKAIFDIDHSDVRNAAFQKLNNLMNDIAAVSKSSQATVDQKASADGAYEKYLSIQNEFFVNGALYTNPTVGPWLYLAQQIEAQKVLTPEQEQLARQYNFSQDYIDTHQQVLKVMLPSDTLPAFPRSLPTNTDPVRSKLLKDLTPQELDRLLQEDSGKMQNYIESVFAARGVPYHRVNLISFNGKLEDLLKRGGVFASHDVGIYYDPPNRTVYVDTAMTQQRWNSEVYSNATAATFDDIIAHELAHYVAWLLYVDQMAQTLAGSSNYLPYSDPNGYRVNVLLELQADTLGGVIIGGSGVLRAGDPQEIYFVNVGEGDDLVRRDGRLISLQDSVFNPAATHPRGIERGQAVYEGMSTVDFDAAIGMLGIQPRWNNAAIFENPQRVLLARNIQDSILNKITLESKATILLDVAMRLGQYAWRSVQAGVQDSRTVALPTLPNKMLPSGTIILTNGAVLVPDLLNESVWDDIANARPVDLPLIDREAEKIHKNLLTATIMGVEAKRMYQEGEFSQMMKEARGGLTELIAISDAMENYALHNNTQFGGVLYQNARDLTRAIRTAATDVGLAASNAKGRLTSDLNYALERGNVVSRYVDEVSALMDKMEKDRREGIRLTPSVPASVTEGISPTLPQTPGIPGQPIQEGIPTPSGFTTEQPGASVPQTVPAAPAQSPSRINKVLKWIEGNILGINQPEAAEGPQTIQQIAPSQVAPGRVGYFIPKNTDLSKPVEVVYFLPGNDFNGIKSSIGDSIGRQQVLQQVVEAGGNRVLAVLEIPSPVDRNSGALGTAAGWQRFADETNKKFAALSGDPSNVGRFANAPIMIIGYSGGYLPAGAAVDGLSSRIRAVQILDGAYGSIIPQLTEWMAQNPDGTLLSECSATCNGNAALAQQLKQRGISVNTDLARISKGANVVTVGGPHGDFVQTGSPITKLLRQTAPSVPTPTAPTTPVAPSVAPTTFAPGSSSVLPASMIERVVQGTRREQFAQQEAAYQAQLANRSAGQKVLDALSRSGSAWANVPINVADHTTAEQSAVDLVRELDMACRGLGFEVRTCVATALALFGAETENLSTDAVSSVGALNIAQIMPANADFLYGILSKTPEFTSRFPSITSPQALLSAWKGDMTDRGYRVTAWSAVAHFMKNNPDKSLAVVKSPEGGLSMDSGLGKVIYTYNNAKWYVAGVVNGINSLLAGGTPYTANNPSVVGSLRASEPRQTPLWNAVAGAMRSYLANGATPAPAVAVATNPMAAAQARASGQLAGALARQDWTMALASQGVQMDKTVYSPDGVQPPPAVVTPTPTPAPAPDPALEQKKTDLQKTLAKMKSSVREAEQAQADAVRLGETAEALTPTLDGLRAGKSVMRAAGEIAEKIGDRQLGLAAADLSGKIDQMIPVIQGGIANPVSLMGSSDQLSKSLNNIFAYGKDISTQAEKAVNSELTRIAAAQAVPATTPVAARASFTAYAGVPSVNQPTQPAPQTAPKVQSRIVGTIPAQAHPRILLPAAYASAALPPGYTVILTPHGVYRAEPSIPDSMHGPMHTEVVDGVMRSSAIDFQIIDPQGRPLANIRSPQNFQIYWEFAKNWKSFHDALYPNLTDEGRWGGFFSDVANDMMHIDLKSRTRYPTAAGSWENGLSGAYASFAAPGQDTRGMGNIASYQVVDRSGDGVTLASAARPLGTQLASSPGGAVQWVSVGKPAAPTSRWEAVFNNDAALQDRAIAFVSALGFGRISGENLTTTESPQVQAPATQPAAQAPTQINAQPSIADAMINALKNIFTNPYNLLYLLAVRKPNTGNLPQPVPAQQTAGDNVPPPEPSVTPAVFDSYEHPGYLAISREDAIALFDRLYRDNPELPVLDKLLAEITSGRVMTETQARDVAALLERTFGGRHDIRFKFVGDAEDIASVPTLDRVVRNPDGSLNLTNKNYGSWSEADKTVYFREAILKDGEVFTSEMQHEIGAVLLGKEFGAKANIPRIELIDGTDVGWTTHALDSYKYNPAISSTGKNVAISAEPIAPEIATAIQNKGLPALLQKAAENPKTTFVAITGGTLLGGAVLEAGGGGAGPAAGVGAGGAGAALAGASPAAATTLGSNSLPYFAALNQFPTFTKVDVPGGAPTVPAPGPATKPGWIPAPGGVPRQGGVPSYGGDPYSGQGYSPQQLQQAFQQGQQQQMQQQMQQQRAMQQQQARQAQQQALMAQLARQLQQQQQQAGQQKNTTPPTIQFSASPAAATLNASTTLQWTSTNTTSCYIFDPAGKLVTQGSQSGSYRIAAVTKTTTYSMTCTSYSYGKNTYASTTVRVATSTQTSGSPR